MTRPVLAVLALVAIAGIGGGYYYAHNIEQYAPDASERAALAAAPSPGSAASCFVDREVLAGTAGVPTIRLNTGYLMPKLGLGTSQITGLDTTRVIAQALVLGYRHFDTAIMYGEAAACTWRLFVGRAAVDSDCCTEAETSTMQMLHTMQPTKLKLDERWSLPFWVDCPVRTCSLPPSWTSTTWSASKSSLPCVALYRDWAWTTWTSSISTGLFAQT